MSDRHNFIKLLFEGQSQGDGVVLVLSMPYVFLPKDHHLAEAEEARTREHLFLAYTAGLMNVVVVITQMNRILDVLRLAFVFCTLY